jgi:hypothetical protein
LSLLSDFEDRVGRAVEGGFARVFRSPVQPAELAKAAGKEADRGRKVGVGKVYAPTLYNVLLSPEDDENLSGFAETLAGELETYLVGYARERSYTLAARPVVRFIVDPELRLGRFDIIGELLSPEELAEELGEEFEDEQDETPAAPAANKVGPTTDAEAAAIAELAALGQLGTAAATERKLSIPIIKPGLFFDAEAEDSDDMGAPAPGIATITVRGVDHDVVLRGDRMVVGRLSTCEISLQDKNTSRQHAAFVKDGVGWAVEDLGSTNGTLVNGRRVDRMQLRDNDVIVVGITELIYHEPRG